MLGLFDNATNINTALDKKKSIVADVVLILLVLSVLYIIVYYAQQVNSKISYVANVNLSPVDLIKYSIYSLSRAIAAYLLSLSFTIMYGYFMYKNKTAEKLLLPILDILQSIPVLGFLPGVVLAMIAIFPHSNIGLELSSIIMIFTGQVWNMVFGFYETLKLIPKEFEEIANLHKLSAFQKFKWIEFPITIPSLVWNSMMSMAGGWFFLMVCEEFTLGNKNFRLEGIGSYMSIAASRGDYLAMFYGILAMIIIIILLDQFIWQPLVAWSEKFKVEYSITSKPKESWFLNLLIDSNILEFIGVRFRKFNEHLHNLRKNPFKKTLVAIEKPKQNKSSNIFSITVLTIISIFILYSAYKVSLLITNIQFNTWLLILKSDCFTLIRVLLAVIIGSAWTVPFGLYIGLSPKLSKIIQPIIQISASFPAPMLFPIFIWIFYTLKINLGIGSIILMLLGTQWYILFNVIAGAISIPSEFVEMGKVFKLSLWQRFKNIYFKTIFPYLVTGWITAAGGAWNASIVAEYVNFKNQTFFTTGLGSLITQSSDANNLPLLAASVLTMVLTVVFFNKLVWKNLYKISISYRVR